MRVPSSPVSCGTPRGSGGPKLCPTKEEPMFRKLVLAPLVVAALAGSAVAALAARSDVPMGGMGMTHNVLRPAFFGYYDGHKDTYLNLDVSSKSQATAFHINYSAKLGKT